MRSLNKGRALNDRFGLNALDKFFAVPFDNAEEQEKALLQSIAELQQIIQREEKQVTFFGSFKAGKSTLLNAIIGISLLPARANRATGAITKISYAARPSASIVQVTQNTSFREEKVPFDDVGKYILLDVSRTISRVPKGIEEALIRVPLPIVQNGCTLVDTPGLFDNAALTERSYEQLRKSDLAVMVLSADQLLASKEKDAAKEVHDLLNGNVVFVLNRLNMVDEEDREETLDWAQSALRGFGNPLVGQPRIFPIQAKDALKAKTNGSIGGPSTDGLLEFEWWLETLLNTPSGEKVAALSRLGILESHLTQAHEYLHNESAKAKATAKRLRQIAKEAHAQQLARHRRNVAEDRARLVRFRGELDKLDSSFVKSCVEDAEEMMESDQEWSKKLSNCVDAPLRAYAQGVKRGADAATFQTSLGVPDFDLQQSATSTEVSASKGTRFAAVGAAVGFLAVGGLDGGLISGTVGAAVGSWLGKTFFGGDIKKKTLESVEQTARSIVQLLRAEAENYLDRVDALLVNFEESNNPKLYVTTELRRALQAEEHYDELLVWCDEFREAIAAIQKKVAA